MERFDDPLPTLAELRARLPRGEARAGDSSAGGSIFARAVSILRQESPPRDRRFPLASRALGATSPSTPPSQRGAGWRSFSGREQASYSPEAELSVRSAFAGTEASPSAASNSAGYVTDSAANPADIAVALRSSLEEQPLHASGSYAGALTGDSSSPAAQAGSSPGTGTGSSSCSGAASGRPFLRKGTRMARSQPPGSSGQRDGATASARLQPREAFKQAAALTSSTASAGKQTGKTRQVKQTRRTRSLGHEVSAVSSQPITPQRSRSRPHCAITPAAVAGPAQRRDNLPLDSPPPKDLDSNVSGGFAWRDPCASPRQDDRTHKDAPKPEVAPRPFESIIANHLNRLVAPKKVGHPPEADAMGQHTSKPPAPPRDLRGDFDEVKTAVGSAEAHSSGHLRLLDAQILQFRQDNEALARLRKQAELAEIELADERETLRCEVRDERAALRAEVEQERQALRRERVHLDQEAERRRRAAANERLELREHIDELREELKTKEQHWQRNVDRLQRQVDDLSRKNRELSELRPPSSVASSPPAPASYASYNGRQTANAGDRGLPEHAHGASEALPLPDDDVDTESFGPDIAAAHRQALETSQLLTAEVGRFAEVPPLPGLATMASSGAAANGVVGATAEPEAEEGPEADSSTVHDLARTDLQGYVRMDSAAAATRAQSRERRPLQLPGWRSAPAVGETEGEESDANTGPQIEDDAALQGIMVSEAHGADGRTQRFFEDGRCEVVFPSGLRKVLWPDGRTSVFFQNGDVKESHPDGAVVYRYRSTGAVQTTQADGTEVYRFAGGQVEWHRPDGAKEIEFANGARKRISPGGFEEVRPAHSGGTWMPAEPGSMDTWAAGAGA